MATERYHPLVADDLVDACSYFDAIGSQVGNRFRRQVLESIAAIKERPESFGRIGSDYRGDGSRISVCDSIHRRESYGDYLRY